MHNFYILICKTEKSSPVIAGFVPRKVFCHHTLQKYRRCHLWGPTRHWTCSALTMDFLVCRSERNKCSLLISYLVCGILWQHPKQTKIFYFPLENTSQYNGWNMFNILRSWKMFSKGSCRNSVVLYSYQHWVWWVFPILLIQLDLQGCLPEDSLQLPNDYWQAYLPSMDVFFTRWVFNYFVHCKN